MPVVRVHRGVITQLIENVGTQVIEAGGAFNLNGYVVFELDPTIYTQPGTYILVDYNAAGPSGFTWIGGYATGQEALNEYAIVDASQLIGLTAASSIPVVDTVNNRITVTLN